MKKYLFSIMVLIFSHNAMADMPLSIEDILTSKGKFKLDAALSYVNRESSRSEPALPIHIQIDDASFVPVPTVFQESSSNSDILIGSLGLRYGLTGKTDLYGNISYLWRETRAFNIDTGIGKTNSSHRLSDISLGVSRTFLKDNKNPALIGFIEGMYQPSRTKNEEAEKSWLLGITTYKAIDPVVLSLTAAYRFHLSQTLEDNKKYQAGNYLLLNPYISFAANDRISITGGVQWLAKQPERLDSQARSAFSTATYARFGVGFAFTEAMSLSASARFKLSGSSSADLRLGAQYAF